MDFLHENIDEEDFDEDLGDLGLDEDEPDVDEADFDGDGSFED